MTSLSFKSRYRLLLAAGILTSAMVAFFVVWPAVDLLVKLAQFSEGHARSRRSDAEVIESQKILSKFFTGERDTLERSAFESISRVASVLAIEIVDFKTFELTDHGNVTTHVAKVGLTGSFHNITKLLYHFDKNSQRARVVSVNFGMTSDKRARKQELYCEVYLRTILVNKNESP